MEGQGRSRKVMYGLFPSLDWHYTLEKLLVVVVVVVACRILDVGLGFGTGLGLDNTFQEE